jgi:predicted metal-dependent phosphoesterase TrpH
MPRVDLHTHSIASHDGSITEQQYKKVLDSGTLDCIAITDHNRIDFALKLQEQLGIDKIIVGEEIMTTEGEIVGLFLNKHITPNQSLEATISDIKKQDGIVYVPHPFETVRKGLSSVALERVQEEIDIIESANGRALFQNKGPEAHAWAHLRRVATFASSDAHRAKALGKTHTTLEKTPTKETLVSLARKGKKSYTRPNLGDVLAPKRAKIVKIIRRQKNA